jgi:hypothetical protein
MDLFIPTYYYTVRTYTFRIQSRKYTILLRWTVIVILFLCDFTLVPILNSDFKNPQYKKTRTRVYSPVLRIRTWDPGSGIRVYVQEKEN